MLDAVRMRQVEAMLEGEPERAVEAMEHWCDHSSVAPINYIAMIRFDAGRLGLTHDLSGTGEVPADATEEERVRALIMAADHQPLTVIDELLAGGCGR
ncbi:MAG: hypothetical protein QOH15_147 [Gaiellales bacterium]|jgi:hypothetical protein|nr:hypothetical protein [Gaiellales bacterium]